MFISRSLAFIVVHKHNAASKSASPPSTGQQVLVAPEPIPMWTKPPNKSTQASSFRVLIGHACLTGGGGDGTFGGGAGSTLGGGGGLTFGGDGGLTFGGGGGQGTFLGGGGGDGIGYGQ